MQTSALTPCVRPNLARALLLHVAAPLLAALALVGLYLTPAGAIGSLNRAIAALVVAAAAGIAAILCGSRAARLARKNDKSAGWWLASTVILVVPLIFLVWPLS
jgi:hypothetical protein